MSKATQRETGRGRSPDPSPSGTPSDTYRKHGPKCSERTKYFLLLPFPAPPFSPVAPRHKCPCMPPPWSGLRSLALLCSQPGVFSLRSPSLKRARASRWRRKRVCGQAWPPSLLPLCGFLPPGFSLRVRVTETSSGLLCLDTVCPSLAQKAPSGQSSNTRGGDHRL